MWGVFCSVLNRYAKLPGFLGLALGTPFLGWCLLSFGRVLLYFGQQQVADGWDKAREEDLVHKIRRGRRVQQVLGVSLHTALREPETSSATQLTALLSGAEVLEAQPCRPDQAVSRHSRLTSAAHENPEQVLGRAFGQLLADLLPVLRRASADTQLAVLLEVDSALPKNVWQDLWRQAWSESGIRQPTVPVEGSGLAVLDQWLDQRIGDKASLLVVALQFAPQQAEGTAEAAVGLLFGNRLTQTVLPQSPTCIVRSRSASRTPTRCFTPRVRHWNGRLSMRNRSSKPGESELMCRGMRR